MQKYSLDENYFHTIDSEHKAYWLGFLYADASLCKTTQKASGKNRLQIVLSKKDIEQLEKFKKDLYFTGPICIKKYTNNFNSNAIAYIYINSRVLCYDLEQLGFDIKDNRNSIPNIDMDLKRHFIRGYFDGDGCISVYEYDCKGKYNIYHRHCQEFSITSPVSILLEIKKEFELHCNVSTNVKLKIYKRTSKAVSLRYGKKQDVVSLYHYLYDGATIYMQRKYDNFQKVLIQ